MNRNQKIVLIIGAIALIIVILTAPEVYLIPVPGGGYWRRDMPREFPYSDQATVDMPATILRISGVLLATFLVWYALKDKKTK